MFQSFNARAVGLAGLSASTTIELASSAGFEGVDLLVRDIVQAGDDLIRLRHQMDDLNLKPGAFPLMIDWKGDESRFLQQLEDLPRYADAAQALGLTRTATWVCPETPQKTTDRAAFAAMHVRRLGAIARILHDRGIRLGLEVIGVASFRSGQGEPFVARMGDLDRELGPIWDESPDLGILADVFHLHAADEPVEACLAWGIDRVVWAHVADLPAGASTDRSTIVDAHRGLPGDHGAIDVTGFLDVLARAGFDGPVTVEPLANCQSLIGRSPDVMAGLVKRALDQVWPVSK